MSRRVFNGTGELLKRTANNRAVMGKDEQLNVKEPTLKELKSEIAKWGEGN